MQSIEEDWENFERGILAGKKVAPPILGEKPSQETFQMSQSIKQDRIEEQARYYKRLSVQVNKTITDLRDRLKDAQTKVHDPKMTESMRLVWKGQEIAISNSLEDLLLANERAHY